MKSTLIVNFPFPIRAVDSKSIEIDLAESNGPQLCPKYYDRLVENMGKKEANKFAMNAEHELLRREVLARIEIEIIEPN